MTRRQALRALENHLEEAIGVTDAGAVVEHLEERVTRDDLDDMAARLGDRIDAKLDVLAHRLTAQWRRDLLLVMTGQFVALAGVLTAIT